MHKISHTLPLLATSALFAFFTSSMALATDGTWRTSASNADWSDVTKWIDGDIADGVGAIATFDRTLYTGGRTATLDSNRTLGQIQAINTNASGLRNVIIGVSNNSVLTLDNGPSDAIINSSGNGALFINPATSLLSNLKVTNSATTYLTLGSTFSGSAGLKTITLDSSVNRINLSGSISDGLGQVEVIVDTGSLGAPANFFADHTFTGGLTINSGAAVTNASASTLGAGNVNVLGGKLTIGNTDSMIEDAILSFVLSAAIDLNYSGEMTISGLVSGSDSIASGTYSASDLNTYFGGSTFTGTGFISVIPEPGQYAIMAGALLGAVAFLRRRHGRADK
ncbi:hypothetical protein H5P28_06380 [Ruficoccus amylovorans]|uniref:PEP-CTERM protein-sorting domain-containing protein n=1 Tax=Ruficoccus amylovorans TaxID=1804625 RepID=A0A842HEC9_9BACT|nr:hypothetical protein [Ruficoccus amylovorans]MBC2593884.1 hypothetical protein [Ruficoccus amylovorans]